MGSRPTVTERLIVSGVGARGEGVGRQASGRVLFVPGALPGEVVDVEVVDEHRRHGRARLVEVIEAAPERVDPPCPFVASGCGGCDLQHATPVAQRALRATVVADALERIGRLSDVPPVETVPLPAEGARTTLRSTVTSGRAAFRRRASHEPIVVDECLIAHPRLGQLLVEGEFGAATEVTLRVGARTGDRLALIAPTVEGVSLPDDVVVVGADELAGGRRAWYHEEVAGRRWRISAGSFFQSRPDGAEALVETVGRHVRHQVGTEGATLVDLYGGVGLFAGTVGSGHRVTLVERNRSAVADARVNLAGHPAGARFVTVAVERWRPSRAQVVIADPARAGLGRRGVTAVAATGADLVVLVSCDAGSLGRDAGLLVGEGYELTSVTAVDMFPHTGHVEVVTTWHRTSRGDRPRVAPRRNTEGGDRPRVAPPRDTEGGTRPARPIEGG